MTDKKTEKKKPRKTESQTIKMVSESGAIADVHPAEVENYRKGGYREV